MENVIVLLSTYNGEKYLRTQIDSVLLQKNVNVLLLVRDDGSSDSTKDILNEYFQKGKLIWYEGENLRSAQSFFDLIFHAPKADYYAFCDQDDFWESNKLDSAIKCLNKFDETKPLLYCSATKFVDADLNPLKIKSRPGVTSFNQSIVSTNATGCTMCFNDVLFNLIRKHRPISKIMHDGWVHKLCLAVGGFVYYDNNSYILYRQHANNVIGAKSSFTRKWKSRWINFKKTSKFRSTVIQEILKNYKELMPAENIEMANVVAQYDQSLCGKLRLAFGKKIFFPVKETDLMFRIAVLLGSF